MKLFHGSSIVVERPDVSKSRANLDFGRGFYLTSHREQAKTWALRKAALEKTRSFLNVYEFDETAIDNWSVLRFQSPDESWVKFVCECRRGSDIYKEYDLVIGGVANDRVYYAVDMYYQGLWDMQTTLDALRYYGVNDQWCFISQSLLNASIRFLEYSEVCVS